MAYVPKVAHNDLNDIYSDILLPDICPPSTDLWKIHIIYGSIV